MKVSTAKYQEMLSKIGNNFPDEERAMLSMEVIKINKRGKEQNRVLLLTEKALYNLKPNETEKCQRRVALEKIVSVTVSDISQEFAIHIPEEYDYRFKSQYKDVIVSVLGEVLKRRERRKLTTNHIKHESTESVIVTEDMARSQTREQRLSRYHDLIGDDLLDDDDEADIPENAHSEHSIGSDYPLPPKQRISTLSETHRKSSTFDDAKEGSDDDAEPVHSPPTPPTPPGPKASKKPNAAKFANLENMLKMRRLPMAPRPLQTEAPESKEVDSPRDPDTEKLEKFRKRLKIGVPRNGVLRMMRDDQMPEHLIRKLFPEEFQAEQPKKMTLRLERILTPNLRDTIWDEMDMISPRIGVERHSQRNLLESKFLRKQALKRSKKETVSSPKTMGLGAQRVKDIEIFLGQLGQLQLDLGSLCEAMLKMDATKLSLDAVQILAKVVPTEHEEAMLRKHRNQSNLNKAERFLVAVGAVDTKLAQRMELWAFAMEFDALCGDAELSLRILRSGHDAIKQSKSLKLMFKLILNVGNHLNSGSSPKRESGFKLSSLGQLKQCRDVENPKENLMEHLAASSDPEHREALQFTAELRPLGEASAVDVANLRAKCDDISSQLKVLGERLNGAVSRRSEDRFESVMRPFYGAASERVSALIAQKKAVFGDMERLAIWLHEPKNDKFPFLKTLSKFRLDFEHSIQSVEQRKQQMDSHRQ